MDDESFLQLPKQTNIRQNTGIQEYEVPIIIILWFIEDFSGMRLFKFIVKDETSKFLIALLKISMIPFFYDCL